MNECISKAVEDLFDFKIEKRMKCEEIVIPYLVKLRKKVNVLEKEINIETGVESIPLKSMNIKKRKITKKFKEIANYFEFTERTKVFSVLSKEEIIMDIIIDGKVIAINIGKGLYICLECTPEPYMIYNTVYSAQYYPIVWVCSLLEHYPCETNNKILYLDDYR